MKIPIMLEVKNRKILIVGGGKIGYRKAVNFVKNSGSVTCISPSFDERFSGSGVECIEGIYCEKYLEGQDIVIAATDDNAVNEIIYNDCKKRNILCMTTDNVNLSDFDSMAYREKEDLLIAVSTRGKSPKFSKEIIGEIMSNIDETQLNKLKRLIRVGYTSLEEHSEGN